jgi:hypothetical protein
VEPSESEINLIRINSVDFEKLIFTLSPLKFVKGPFGMKYDQRVIIKFLWNERTDAHQIAAILQAQFAEHAYQLRTVQFWITEIQRGRQDLHDEIRRGRPPLDGLDAKILAVLNKSPFQSFSSTAERLAVSLSTVLQYFHESIGFNAKGERATRAFE